MKKSLILCTIISLFFGLFLSSAEAGPNWNQLTKEQRHLLKQGELLLFDAKDPAYNWGQITFYALVQEKTPRAANPLSARSCAAVFWDVKGQTEYQNQLKSVDYVPLFSDSRSNPTLMNFTTRGLTSDITYSQLMGMKAYGKTYMASWLSISAPLPGIVERVDGTLTLEELPFAKEVLLIYTAKANAAALVEKNAALRQSWIQNTRDSVARFRNRMSTGATGVQIAELDRAVSGR